MKTKFLKTWRRQGCRISIGCWLSAGLLLAGAAGLRVAGEENGFRVVQPAPGGINPHPVITSITTTQGVRLSWVGVQAPYQVQQKSKIDGPWTDVGKPTNGFNMTLPLGGAGGVFHRVVGGEPQYQGIANCADCHGPAIEDWSKTAHGRAYQTLKNIGQQNNPQCVVCHTVGASAPGGFLSESLTPQFENVQCENCHGPAGDHLNSGDPPTVFPVSTRSAMLCGGCHNGFHHPTYEDWSSSKHSGVIADLVGDFSSTNRTTAIGRMNTCGACHSGAVRLAMIRAYNAYTGDSRTNVNWPGGIEATNTGTTCIVCHDTHQVHVYNNPLNGTTYTNQLRYPIVSTNFFSYNTGTNFAAQYDPTVSICGQCHNARGASVASSGRPPHYSPQYNIMLGNIGVLTNALALQGAHRTNALQCAGCHTHGVAPPSATASNPVYTGHGFKPTLEACMVCHTDTSGSKAATNLLATTQAEIKGKLAAVKGLLDLWATTKNPNTWASKYGALGWEYTTPGDLSNPTASTTIVGPTATEQGQIPQGIKDARFNLYLVSRDRSYGVHNAPYIRNLLTVAEMKVNTELAKP